MPPFSYQVKWINIGGVISVLVVRFDKRLREEIYCDFQNVVYFRPICNSRIQRLQKKKLATFSHIMATNTYLRGRQHAESTESNCFHKLTEENCTNNNNSPHIHCKNALPLAEFGTFSPVARHAAMLC